MDFLLPLAILAGSAYQGNQARLARQDAERQQKKALKQQMLDAEAMRAEIARQTTEYGKQSASLQEQAALARDKFQLEQKNYAENKLAMDKKAKEVQEAADEERRKAAAAEASALKARRLGGRRMLLSQDRDTPELGIYSDMLGNAMRVS